MYHGYCWLYPHCWVAGMVNKHFYYIQFLRPAHPTLPSAEENQDGSHNQTAVQTAVMVTACWVTTV